MWSNLQVYPIELISIFVLHANDEFHSLLLIIVFEPDKISERRAVILVARPSSCCAVPNSSICFGGNKNGSTRSWQTFHSQGFVLGVQRII